MKHSSAWMVPTNSVLLSNGATIGECSITTFPLCTKQGILGIVPNKRASAEFLYYLFKSKKFKAGLRKITTKGTMDAVYLKDLKKVSVPVCDIKDQERFICLMKPLERRVSLEKNMLAALKKLKARLLSSMFI